MTIKLSADLLKSQEFCGFSNKELKEKLNSLKSNFNESFSSIVELLIESIKRIYSYEINEKDIEKLNDFLENTTSDNTNDEAFYPFLIYTILKEIQNEHVHCLFIDEFSARTFFIKAAKLYELLNIKASLNFNPNKDIATKGRIFSANIIYSKWNKLVLEQILNLNIEKIQERMDLKFDNAFIFDIDRIIYDYQKFNVKIQMNSATNELNVKEYFKLYKNIVGVSSGLAFEDKKIKKSYSIKTKINSNVDEIIEKIKNSNEQFYSNKDKKINALGNKIIELHKQNETLIVDVDDIEEIEALSRYLKTRNVKHQVISEKTNIEEFEILKILTPNKITLITNLLSANIVAKPGGDWEEIAFRNTWSINNDVNSNFYKEKLKKELKLQKEIADENCKLIKEKGGITLLFASHYIELKNEYIIVKNYFKAPIKNICFFNSPEDEAYQQYRLGGLRIFNLEHNQDTDRIFKILAKFLFYLKKFSINKILAQENGYLTFSVNNPQNNHKQVIKTNKIGRNDPCYCGSGKKYKNCCGK